MGSSGPSVINQKTQSYKKMRGYKSFYTQNESWMKVNWSYTAQWQSFELSHCWRGSSVIRCTVLNRFGLAWGSQDSGPPLNSGSWCLSVCHWRTTSAAGPLPGWCCTAGWTAQFPLWLHQAVCSESHSGWYLSKNRWCNGGTEERSTWLSWLLHQSV